MHTYVITGASRGLGYAFVEQLSRQPGNRVFGLARDKAATEQKVRQDGLQNVTILQADVTDRAALNKAAAEIAKTMPAVDYLINNAAYLSGSTAMTSLSDYADQPEKLEEELVKCFQANVLGVVNTVNAFLSLVQKSAVKKVVNITTGLADDKLTNDFDLYEAAPYSISKAALNTVVAKYSAKHKSEGILFISISPGLVNTGNESNANVTSESTMAQKFAKAYPDFQGAITPEESVKAVMQVVEKASPTNEFAGAFVSHFGTKTWL